MVLGTPNVISMTEMTLLSHDHVCINAPIPTTKAHRFCDTQPTTSFTLLRILLMLGKASTAFTPIVPSSNAKALSSFLNHSFTFSGLSPPLPRTAAPPLPGSNA